MDSRFDNDESLIRAVRSRPRFWENGRLSSAALKDPNGLSVTRTYDRSLEDTIEWMQQNFEGVMVVITVRSCLDVEAYVKYCPSSTNRYHSEIHGSKDEIELSDFQALYLARHATLDFSSEEKEKKSLSSTITI